MEACIATYIAQYDTHQQQRMMELYEIIKQGCPEAQEKISWGMPTFVYYGNLVHFAQQKKHMGFYPGESGVANFVNELDKLGLRHSKGAIQIPDSCELPRSLIEKIVHMRMKENKEWTDAKKEK